MGQNVRQIRKAAERYVEGQPSVPPHALPQLLSDTAVHLVDLFRLERAVAGEHALAAWAEVEGRRSRCYVDLKASTPHLVILVDPVARTRRPFPVVDLLRLLGPRAAGQPRTAA